jgi:beta-alanine--pyruvate transaminase
MACAAGLAALGALESEGLIAAAARLERVLEDAVHSLRDEPHVADIRNIGLAAAIELKPVDGAPGKRALEAFEKGLDAGLLLRFSGETLALAPPFIAGEDDIRRMIETLRGVLRRL